MAETENRNRFAGAARAAHGRTPTGISRKEGWIILLLAVAGGIHLTILFQAHSWEWGGIIRFLTQVAYLAVLIALTGQITMARGVHPVGHRRRIILADIPIVLAAVVGGWFWTAQPGRDTPGVITTAVAMLSTVPFTVVGLHLISKGGR